MQSITRASKMWKLLLFIACRGFWCLFSCTFFSLSRGLPRLDAEMLLAFIWNLLSCILVLILIRHEFMMLNSSSNLVFLLFCHSQTWRIAELSFSCTSYYFNHFKRLKVQRDSFEHPLMSLSAHVEEFYFLKWIKKMKYKGFWSMTKSLWRLQVWYGTQKPWDNVHMQA